MRTMCLLDHKMLCAHTDTNVIFFSYLQDFFMNVIVNLMLGLISSCLLVALFVSFSYVIQRLLSYQSDGVDGSSGERIRKKWLSSFSYFVTIFVVAFSYEFYYIFCYGTAESFSYMWVYFLLGCVLLYSTYSCAYRKRGTRFIIFAIIFFSKNFLNVMPMMFLLSYCTINQVVADIQSAPFSKVIFSSVLATGPLFAMSCGVRYLINSIRLFRVNRAYKKNKPQAVVMDSPMVDAHRA